MFDLGRHAEFIWLSYGAVAIVAVGIVAWLWLEGRRQALLLADLEARGVRRRSSSDPSQPVASNRS